MKSIEDLKAEQAKQLATLQTELNVAEACPVTPDRVMSFNPYPWLTFKDRTLAEALEIFKAFNVEPMYKLKSNTLQICPEAGRHNQKAEYKITGGPYAMSMTVDTGSQFGPSAKLEFFATIDTGLCKVCVDLKGPGYIGTFPTFNAPASEQRNSQNRLVARSYGTNAMLNGLFDGLVSWASGDMGPVKTSASHTYLLIADHEGNAPGAENEHACNQLTNLIDLMGSAK